MSRWPERILPGFCVRVGHDPLDFGVDQPRGVFRVGAALGAELDVEELVALVAVVVDGAERVAHAPFGDHRPGDVGGALQVVLGAGGNLAEGDLLGRAAAEQHRELIEQILALHQVTIFERQLHRVAERAEAALHDRDLVHRIHVGDERRDERVARLVIRDDLALLLAHDPLLLEPRDQPIDRLVEVGHLDRGLVLAGGEQRGFVDQVGQVGAGKAGRALRDDLEIDVGAELHVLGVDAQDLFASFHVRLVDQDLPVEPAGTEQGRVEHLGPVGRGHDDDRLARIESVHLRQQLVQRLFALLVRSHRALHAGAPERVELVDEDDAGRLLLGLREQVAHARGADADEHLDELGSAQAEEGHLGFAGDGARQQRLAGAGRADEQDALRDAAAERGVFLRRLQELDDLLELLLGLVHAGDVGEAHLHVVFGKHAVLAARERHHAAFGAAHAPDEEAPDGEQQQDRDDPAEDFRQPPADLLAGVLDARGIELFDQLRDLRSGRC